MRLEIYIIPFLILSSLNMIAQLSIQAERPSAMYEVGEIANYQIFSNISGEVDYSIKYDNLSLPIETGKVKVTAGEPFMLPLRMSEPGMYACEITQGTNSDFASIALSPFSINVLDQEPADLDAFWNSALAELAAIPIDPQVTFLETVNGGTVYRVNLATVSNRRVYGYIVVPDDPGPYSAVLTVPPFSGDVNSAIPDPFLTERMNVLSMSISIHNAEPDELDPNAYQPNDLTDPEGLYYRLAVLACVRSIDYIFSRSDFDGENLIINGVSQGGGLSIVTAGLDPRVKILAFSNPALCQHSGLIYDKASGFPYYAHASRALNTDFSIEPATIEAAKYVDAIHFAKRFKGPCLAHTGYEDLVCPSAGVFAAYNQIRGPKVLIHAKEMGHNTPNDYWTGRIAFYRKHIPTLVNPDFPWETTGYFADAGNDQTTTVNTAVSLNGLTELDDNIITTWDVYWEKVEGPGKVSFSNPNSRTTTATFSEPGTYMIRFYSHDDQYLGSEQKRITVEDVVRIVVQ